MSLTRNKVKSIIKKLFTKRLVDLGFKQRKDSLGAYRVRGEFVDVVSIQIGRNPGSLYLHYFTNFLADPFTNLLNSITVGKRFMGTENGGEPWMTDIEKEIYPMIDKIWCSVEDDALPFFNSILDIEQYLKLLEESEKGRPYPLTLALVYAAAGKSENALSLIPKIKIELSLDECFDFENEEEDIALMKNLNSLEFAAQKEGVDSLLTEWSNRNLLEIGLKRMKGTDSK